MERGLVEDDVTVLSLRGLKQRECASCAAYEEGSHILSAAEREGATPCSAEESLRRGGADAEVDPETGPHQRQGAHHATRTRLAAPWKGLDELMQSNASSTGNLFCGDSLAGGGAAVAGRVRVSCLVGGVRDAMASSSVKRHSSIHVANTFSHAIPSIRRQRMACIRLS